VTWSDGAAGATLEVEEISSQACPGRYPFRGTTMRLRRSMAVSIGLVAAILPVTSVFAATTASSKVLYNSLVTSPGNLPSIGFEATQAAQFGNEITLTRSAKVATVVVTMDSWGCQSGTGDTCTTTPGGTFSEQITLNIFQAPTSNPTTQLDDLGNGVPGATILSVTKTFAIPYRPSANNTKCVGDESGNWFDTKNAECFPGLATNITFNLGSLHVTLPQTFVFGIAYNTSDYGADPYGDSTACHTPTDECGYDSLNVGLSYDPDNLNVGSNTYPGYVWWNTQTASDYCDGGIAGTGTFRIDSPSTPACWGVYPNGMPATYNESPWYTPAVEFTTS
jgi:hypothetical protein